jgi:hypothetical protein
VVLLDDQLTSRPSTTEPLPSSACADSVRDSPTDNVGSAGSTFTCATVGVAVESLHAASSQRAAAPINDILRDICTSSSFEMRER